MNVSPIALEGGATNIISYVLVLKEGFRYKLKPITLLTRYANNYDATGFLKFSFLLKDFDSGGSCSGHSQNNLASLIFNKIIFYLTLQVESSSNSYVISRVAKR